LPLIPEDDPVWVETCYENLKKEKIEMLLAGAYFLQNKTFKRFKV